MNALSSSTIKLISSTQVVTSLYAVVKELVENSLDASCDSIDVRLEQNGLGKIEVLDNGSGISSDSICYVCKPHYTSKIRDDTDLLKLSTYGFRGEALSSICSVADVSIITKKACDYVSKQYFFDKNGDVLSEQPTHHNIGTAIIVKNLFNCLPVRKQIYSNSKKLKDELRKIEELLVAYGLAYPKLRITLKNEKNVIWRKDRTASHRDAVRSIFGLEVLENLNEVQIDETNVQIIAFVPQPGCNVDIVSRLVADRIFTYVNKRPVLIKDIKTILKQYFNEHCHVGNKKYPTAIMYITNATDMVDVNLEPNKTTVHLENMETVLNLIRKLLDVVYIPNKENRSEDTPTCERNNDANMNQLDGIIDKGDGNSTLNCEKKQWTSNTNCHNELLDNSYVRNDINLCQDTVINKEDGNNLLQLNSTGVTEVFSKIHQSTPLNLNKCITENENKRMIEEEPVCERRSKREKLTENVQNDLSPNEQSCLDVNLFNDDLDDEFVFNLSSESLTSEKWSRGTGVNYLASPVTLLHSSAKEKTKGNVPVCMKRKMDVCRKIESKSIRNNEMQHKDLLHGVVKKSKRRNSAPLCQIEFSMEFLSKAFKNKVNYTQESTDNRITVIGKIPNTSLWCVSLKNKTYILDKARLSERLLYDQLVKKHKFSVEKLAVPVKLSSDFVGYENFNSLLQMETQTPFTTIGRYVSDRGLVDNGFLIKRVDDKDSAEITFMCTHMTKKIPNYSVRDLIDLLDSMRSDSLCVRSKNAMTWFQMEAARLSQENPELCSKEELEEILADSCVTDQMEKLCCCHDKPVFQEILFAK